MIEMIAGYFLLIFCKFVTLRQSTSSNFTKTGLTFCPSKLKNSSTGVCHLYNCLIQKPRRLSARRKSSLISTLLNTEYYAHGVMSSWQMGSDCIQHLWGVQRTIAVYNRHLKIPSKSDCTILKLCDTWNEPVCIYLAYSTVRVRA